jgi:hypothetical protein
MMESVAVKDVANDCCKEMRAHLFKKFGVVHFHRLSIFWGYM